MPSSISGAMTRLSNYRVVVLSLCLVVIAVVGAMVIAPTAVNHNPTEYKRYEGPWKKIELTPTPETSMLVSPTPEITPSPKPVPSASRITSAKAEPTRSPFGKTLVARGVATWYNDGPGLYGAAGPALRKGNWRGRAVTVCSGSRCVRIRLTDWCACGSRNGRQTVVDLSPSAFRALAPLSRGVITVEVRR